MISTDDYLGMAKRIDPYYFADYLSQKGWKTVTRKRQDIRVFQISQNDSFFQTTIPFDNSLSDFCDVMFESVKAVARFENKTIDQVFLCLSNPDSDILKIRIEKDDIRQGSILIDDAINVFEGAKKLLWAAAQDVIRPSLMHRGRVDSTVSDFVSKCRFGQTEVGSYIVSVVCPIVEDAKKEEQLLLFDSEDYQDSFARKVTTKVMRSITKVKNEIDDGTFSSIFEKEDDAISSNFCEALIGMNLNEVDTTIEVESYWSPKIPILEEVPSFVSLNHNYYAPIISAVSRIKEKSNEQITIHGKVKKLTASPDLLKRESGKISVVYLNADNNARTITATLARDDYDKAIEAHSNGCICKLVGEIPDGKTREMICSSFEIIE